MAKEKFRIKSECPECGCGLICNMTPDDFKKKYGEFTGKVTINCEKCGKDHEGCVIKEE